MDYHQWQIYWAFRNRDHDVSVKLVPYYVLDSKLNSVKGFYGDTLLHLACQNGWLDYVKLIVNENGYDPEVKDCGHQTPLHYTCRYGHLQIVRFLIRDHNCDVAVATRDYWTPLHYACRYGHLSIVEDIFDIPGVMSEKQLQYVDCEYNEDGFQSLVYPADQQKNNSESIKTISTLLQIAHRFGQIHCLCDKLSNHQYLRLFLFCCKHGLLEIVTHLKSDVLNQTDTLGRSGLHYACQEGHIHIAEYLVKKMRLHKHS